MKKQALITIFFLLIVAGRAAGQTCSAGDITGSSSVCLGSTLNLTAHPTGTGPFVYTWESSNTSVATVDNSGVVTPVSAGTTNITYSFNDAQPCTSASSSPFAVQVNALPGAAGSVTGDNSVCQGETGVTYSVPVISDATGYVWSLPVGATIASGANTESITVNFAASATSGDVSVYGTNSCGDGAAANFSVTVNPLPAGAGTITGDNTVCQGESGVAYNVTGISDATGYVWSLPVGATIASGANTESITVNFAASATSGDVSVYGTNACGNGASSSLSITVNPLPPTAGSISGDNTVCQGESGVTYNIAAITNATDYVWTLPSGATIISGANTESITVNYGSSATSGNVSVYGTNACGNGASSSLSITVNPLPSAAGAITGDNSVCQGESAVTYSISAITDADEYVWSVPSGALIVSGSNTTTINVDYGTSAVNGNVTVYGTNLCGNGTSASLAVTVNPLPSAAGAITGDNTVCQGESGVSYSVASIANATGYIWNLPSGAAIAGGTNTRNIAVNYSTSASSGNITVAGTNSCGNGITSSPLIVTTNFQPTLSTLSQSVAACIGAAAHIHLTGLLPSSTFTVHYEIDGDTETPIANVISDASGNAVMNTRNLVLADNSDVLEIISIVVTAPATGCSAPFTGKTLSLNVVPLPDLSNVDQDATVCDGTNAKIELTGLLGSVTSTIEYKIGSTGSPEYVDVVSNGSGYGFFNRPLLLSENGKRLYVTRITTVGPGCTSTFTDNTTLSVNSIPSPVITGPATACAGSSGNTYSTASAMTNYSWSITGGTITSASNIRTITVSWGVSGTGTLTVSSTSNSCTGTSPVHNVTINPVTVHTITGPSNACLNSSGNVYSLPAGMTSYLWSVNPADGTITSANDGSSVTVTWIATGAKTLTVNYVTPTGCNGTSTKPVQVHSLPVVSITSAETQAATPRISDVVTYNVAGGASNWVWEVSVGGSGASSSSSINVTWNATGAQTVKVNFKDANGCSAPVSASYNVMVRQLPSVSGVHIDYIDGDPKIGGTLEVDYTYTDGSSGSDVSTYRWFSNGALIPSATSKTYIAQSSDFGNALTCEVTPVSTVGPPTQGFPVLSGPTLPIENLNFPAVVPVASMVCIDGLRTQGSILKGKYSYTYAYKSEGPSSYRWIRRDSTSAVPDIVIGTGLEYTLTAADLEANKEIYFEVTPVSSNFHPVSGLAKRSKPLARIIGLDDQYGISADTVSLYVNVTGGYFSGPGVTGSKFVPAIAGQGTWEINYFRFYEYPLAHSCSQRVPQTVVVNPNVAIFSSIQNKYCSYDPVFTVNVSNVPVDAVNHMFYLTDPNGIVTTSTYSINIDPSKMTAGVHTLYYSYRRPVLFGFRIYYLYYRIDKSFNVDRVSNDIKFVGIGPSYCENNGQVYVTVEGVYPLGGIGNWTGSILGTSDVFSAYIDPSLGTPGTTYAITYQYTSKLGCTTPILTQNVKINPLPSAAFAIKPSYNVEGLSDKLVPVQSGGIFRGKGISGDLIIPSIAGVGPQAVTYIIRDGNNCIDSLKKNTVIRAALGTITGITDVVCYERKNLNITASGLPVNGTDGIVSFSGFKNTRKTLTPAPGTTTAVYSVPAAGEGNDTLSFSYVWDGVDYTIRKIVNIDSLGTAIIYNLEQNQMICDDVAPFELTVSKPGGVFSGPVVGGYFDPSKATSADTVKYTFTSTKTGCRIDTTIYVRVFKAPKVDFIPYDICINDDQDTLKFMNKTISSDPVVRWNWEFYDEGKMIADSVKESGFLYLKGGLQKVVLSAQTDKGCIVRKEKTFDIARRPEADFYWKKDCFHPGESLQLFDATTYTTQPKSFSWRSNGVEFGTTNNAVYPKTDTGFIKIEYIVRTNYYMCHDTVKKDIYVRPVISVPSDGYFEDFEGGKDGWIIGDPSGIWAFGTPSGNKIKTAASGIRAWYTANAKDGSSSIESPCFDLSLMKRPVVKLKLGKELDKDRDGVALQYRIGDEPDWHYVGTIQDGIGWYNSATISGRPGGNSLGWTTAGAPDPRYKDAVHTLDELIGKKDVKFRMAYGSSGAFSSHDGVAFDDIYIGERSRQVLVEHFTSYNSSDAMSNKALVDTIAAHKAGDVINIQYHTNLAGTDSLYFVNPGEINARILFYGLGRVPYTFVDGGSGNDSTYNKLYDYRSNKIDSNEVTKRTLMNSAFRIHIEPVISGRVLTVKGYIKALENIRINNLTLFIAVTEKKNPGDFAGVPQNLVFLNVFRKFIPDAAGTVLKSSWVAGDSVSISEKAWMIEKVLNSSDIEIIAFLQSSETKEVYQAFSVIKPEIIVGIENPHAKEAEFSLYPNPARNMVNIGFAGPLKNDVFIRIYSIQGEIVREYRAGKGTTEFTIEDTGLKDGIYLVRISSGIFEIGYKKLIISDN